MKSKKEIHLWKSPLISFARSEIWPVNPDVLQKNDFVPSTSNFLISNSGENTEEPSERSEGSLKVTKDSAEEDGAFSPENINVKTVTEICPVSK